MKGTALTELNDKYRDCPVRTNSFFIDGKEYIFHSHFCGNKDIDDVIFALAFDRALSDIFEKTKNIA